jgi:hypothetical protein
MNKFIIFVFLTFVILAVACANKYANETLVFNNYLSETFNINIPDDSHTFLVESSFQCPGCVERTYLSILNHAKFNQQNSITIITFDDGTVPEQLKNTLTVIVDEDAKYESLGIPFGNITVIETQKKRIKSIKSIQLPEIESTIQKLFQ